MQNTFYFWFQKTKKFLHMHNNNVYLSSQTIWIESAFNLLSRLQFELHRNHQTSKGFEYQFLNMEGLQTCSPYKGSTSNPHFFLVHWCKYNWKLICSGRYIIDSNLPPIKSASAGSKKGTSSATENVSSSELHQFIVRII